MKEIFLLWFLLVFWQYQVQPYPRQIFQYDFRSSYLLQQYAGETIAL